VHSTIGAPASRPGGWNLDSGRPDRCGLGNRLAGGSEGVEVEDDCFVDQPLHFISRIADDADARQVRDVRAPGVALVLDYDEILAHLLDLRSPAWRRIFAAVPLGTSAPGLPATVTFPGLFGCSYC
jgi:hypothetical protein